MNIAELVRYWARWRPEHAAVIHDGQPLSWGDFDTRTDAMARGLRRAGVQKGDRVGLLMSNRIEAPIAAIATLKLGAIFVPLNFRLTATELQPLLDDAECRILLTEEAYLGQVEATRSPAEAIFVAGSGTRANIGDLYVEGDEPPAEAVGLTDPAFICYTSGTTGQQKGALLTHGSALYPGLAKNVAEGLTWRDAVLVAVPFVFTGVIIACFIQFTVAAGGTMVLESNFDVDRYLDTIQRHRVSVATTVPIVWERLLRSPGFAEADLSSMISAASGGAPVSVELIEAYREKGVSLIQCYGLTEASGLVATMHSEDAMRRIGWAGRALPGTRLRIADADGQTLPLGEVGEILVKGPHVMQGYWRKPEITAETIVDGWLRTGDLGLMDEDGFVKIMDRSKDMLISGGINVYPAEIERALASVRSVIELAVIGVPDKEWGEVPMAVALCDGDPQQVVREIEAVGARELAGFKRPRHILFRDTPLPRTLSGKVSKPELRKAYPSVPAAALPLFAVKA